MEIDVANKYQFSTFFEDYFVSCSPTVNTVCPPFQSPAPLAAGR
jgi:hypothetical protein